MYSPFSFMGDARRSCVCVWVREREKEREDEIQVRVFYLFLKFLKLIFFFSLTYSLIYRQNHQDWSGSQSTIGEREVRRSSCWIDEENMLPSKKRFRIKGGQGSGEHGLAGRLWSNRPMTISGICDLRWNLLSINSTPLNTHTYQEHQHADCVGS